MATRDELYAKFGITAEAAQLFETELGTLLLGARGLGGNWHVEPSPEEGGRLLEEINRSTLGHLLKTLKRHVEFKPDLETKLTSALKARNRLTHGFYERHNFKIQTDEGRDQMIADLELLHEELFQAWQLASAMTLLLSDIILDLKK